MGVIAAVFTVLGSLRFSFLLVPQLRLNASRQSTEGLNLCLIMIWHVGTSLIVGYLMTVPGSEQEAFCFGIYLLCSSAILGQFAQYRSGWKRAPTSRRHMEFFGASTLAVVVTLLLVLSFQRVMLRMNDLHRFVAGSIVPTLMVLVGFLPQVRQFLVTGAVHGYSFGLSALDVLGCFSNTVVLFVGRDVNVWDALKSAFPLLCIMAAHAVLVVTATVVSFVGVSSKAAGVDIACLDRRLLDEV